MIEIKNKSGEVLVGDLLVKKGDKLIISVNGYVTNRSGGIKRITDFLFSHGFNCLRFDLSGTGESEGDHSKKTITSWVEDTLSVIEYAKSRGYRIALLGASLGATIAMECSLRTSIEKLCLISPTSNWVQQRLEKYGQAFEWKEKGYREEINEKGTFISGYHLWEDAKKYNMWDKTTECETLLVHGDADASVPVSHSKKLIKQLDHGKLVIVKGADHGLKINGDTSKAYEVILHWFKEWT